MVRRGSSGAVFSFTAHDVTKMGDGAVGERVASQGRWLSRHRSHVVPLVLQTFDNGYRMERLATPPALMLDHRVVLEEMLMQLSVNVWTQPPEVPHEPHLTRDRIDLLLGRHAPDDTELVRRVRRIRDGVTWDELEACLTHGDPTFDNVMVREDTGELVLIDPLPATAAVPDLRAVDIGKILQSALGYERVRYRDEARQFGVSPRTLRARVPLDNEWRAAVFWCAVHLLRALPYVPTDLHTSILRLTYDATGLV